MGQLFVSEFLEFDSIHIIFWKNECRPIDSIRIGKKVPSPNTGQHGNMDEIQFAHLTVPQYDKFRFNSPQFFDVEMAFDRESVTRA